MTEKQQIEYIKENYLTMPQKRIAANIGRSYCFVAAELKRQELTIPQEIIDKFKRNGLYRKGHKPHNTGKKMTDEVKRKIAHTFFKKGHKPHNTKYDGHISILEKNGYTYKWIRIRKGQYKLLHRIIWKEHNGPIPEGYNIQFKDGDSLNCDIDNLYIISKRQQAIVNKHGGNALPHEAKKTILLINDIKLRVNEKQNSRSQ